ncbi:hypothetical protein C0995_016267 [Termitomyces sp. Mi166|nr:hypothetical protein C0995_016267 [Termitomyces sp. Mi166\
MAMASVPPASHQGGILPTPLPQPTALPANNRTANASGFESGYIKREELSQIISDFLVQALEKLIIKNPRMCRKNNDNKAAPDVQQQQVMNNMQASVAATLVHKIVQEPRVEQYVLTTNERIEYHQQGLLKLQMLCHGNKHQVADGVQVLLLKHPLADYHPAEAPQSLPNTNTEAGPNYQTEPKNIDKKLLLKDKGKKPMKPTVEEVSKESISPIHPY